jgi:hypothetical protein
MANVTVCFNGGSLPFARNVCFAEWWTPAFYGNKVYKFQQEARPYESNVRSGLDVTSFLMSVHYCLCGGFNTFVVQTDFAFSTFRLNCYIYARDRVEICGLTDFNVHVCMYTAAICSNYSWCVFIIENDEYCRKRRNKRCGSSIPSTRLLRTHMYFSFKFYLLR